MLCPSYAFALRSRRTPSPAPAPPQHPYELRLEPSGCHMNHSDLHNLFRYDTVLPPPKIGAARHAVLAAWRSRKVSAAPTVWVPLYTCRIRAHRTPSKDLSLCIRAAATADGPRAEGLAYTPRRSRARLLADDHAQIARAATDVLGVLQRTTLRYHMTRRRQGAQSPGYT